jgi:hypothetical protein
MAIALQRLADLDDDAGRIDEAAAGIRRYLQVVQELADRDPIDQTYREDVVLAHLRLADLQGA